MKTALNTAGTKYILEVKASREDMKGGKEEVRGSHE
jgi:hypothetical protein